MSESAAAAVDGLQALPELAVNGVFFQRREEQRRGLRDAFEGLMLTTSTRGKRMLYAVQQHHPIRRCFMADDTLRVLASVKRSGRSGS